MSGIVNGSFQPVWDRPYAVGGGIIPLVTLPTPPLVTLPTPPSTLTDKEHTARRRGISASDVPALLGLPGPGGSRPSRTPLDVYNEKIGLQVVKKESDFSDWGNRLERVVAETYAKKHSRMISKPSTCNYEDWALCHPDFMVNDGSGRSTVMHLLEIKTTDKDLAWEWGPDGSSKVPARVEAQVRWQMFVTGYKRVDVAVLIGGNDYREYTIVHDQAWEDRVVPQMKEWWEKHVLQTNPPAGGSRLVWEEVKLENRLYEEPEETLEDNDPELEQLVHTLAAAEQCIEDAELLKTQLRDRLLKRVGKSKGLVGEWGKVSVATVRGREGVDWKTVAEKVKGLVDPSTFMQIVDSNTKRGGSYKRLTYKLTEDQ